jgi:hypothetical protein
MLLGGGRRHVDRLRDGVGADLMGWMRMTRGTTAGRRRSALAAAALAAFLLAGCTAGSPGPDAAPDASATADGAPGLADPLVALTTPGTSEFLSEDLQPALHETGTGPTTYEVPQPDPTVGSLQFFVTCATGEQPEE